MIELFLAGLTLSMIYLYLSVRSQLQANLENQYDANSKSIINLKSPDHDMDAVTKLYADQLHHQTTDKINKLRSHIDRELLNMGNDFQQDHFENRIQALEVAAHGTKRHYMELTDLHDTVKKLKVPFCATVYQGLYLDTSFEPILFDEEWGDDRLAHISQGQIHLKQEENYFVELLIKVTNTQAQTIQVKTEAGQISEELSIVDGIACLNYSPTPLSSGIYAFEMSLDEPSEIYPFVKVSEFPSSYEYHTYADRQHVFNSETKLMDDLATRLDHFQNEVTKKHTTLTAEINAKITKVATDLAMANTTLRGITSSPQLTHIKTDLALLDQKRTQLTADLNDIILKGTELRNAIEQQRSDVETAHTQLETQNKDAKDTLGQVATERLLIQTDQAALQVQWEQLKKASTGAKDTYDVLVAEHMAAKGTSDLLAAEHTGAKKTYHLLEGEHTGAKDTHTVLAAEHTGAKDTHQILAEEHTGAKDTHQVLAAEHTGAKNTHTVLAAEHTGAKDTHTVLAAERTGAKDAYDLLLAEHTGAKSTYNLLVAQETAAQAETASVTRQLATLQKERKETETNTQALLSTVSAAHNALKLDLTTLNADTIALQNELGQLQSWVDKSNFERQEIMADIKKMQQAGRNVVFNPREVQNLEDGLKIYINRLILPRIETIENALNINHIP